MTLFSKNKTPTKMFVNRLSAPKSRGSFNKKSFNQIKREITHSIVEIAPELVEEGFKMLSSTIAGLTEDYISKTILYKNIDGDIDDNIFVPDRIKIIRANFGHQDNSCSDNFTSQDDEKCYRLPDRKLHIELEIKKSRDNQSFYFQPLYYFYKGVDDRGKRIDEVNLSFAFIEATENITDYNSLEYRPIISFKELDNNIGYRFIREDGTYDTTFQSPWISSELSKKGAYTIVIEIEERRYSRPFSRTLNKIYKKHEVELKNKINQEIQKELKRIIN